LHFRLQLFKSAHEGLRRTLMQPGSQLVQLFGRAHGVGFHTTVVEVPDPAHYTNGLSVFRYEPAETDSLDPAGYQPAPRRAPIFQRLLALQWICSDREAAAMAAGTASIAFLTAAQRLWSWNGLMIRAKPFSTT
jgi:hypothetical protein